MADTLGATLRPRATAAAARRSSMRPLVQEPMNTRSIGTSASARARRQAHVGERARPRRAAVLVRRVGRIGHHAGDRQRVLRAGAPGDQRRDVGGVEVELACRSARPCRSAGVASGRAPGPRRRPWARTAGLRGSRRSSRRARSGRRARRPRSTCCRPSCGLPSTARGWRGRHTRSRSRCRRRCRSCR